MLSCEVCGFEASRGSALASHMRWRHPQPDVWEADAPSDDDGPNLQAVKRTIAELDRLGRLEDIDAAFRQALLTLASTLDAHPTSAVLWREYRELLIELLRADEDADDELAAALAQISGAAEVGHTSPS